MNAALKKSPYEDLIAEIQRRKETTLPRKFPPVANRLFQPLKMRYRIICAFILSCSISPVRSEPNEKEVVVIMNKVQSRVAGGDIKALDDLTTLPAQFSTPAFLTIFKQNYNIAGATPAQKAIGERCTQLATATPEGEEYIQKLLKGKPANNYVFYQQDSAIKCLGVLHNDTSVRILCRAIDDVDREEIAPKVARTLSMLNLPGAPISPKDKVSTADALAKWKEWWNGNKDKYVR